LDSNELTDLRILVTNDDGITSPGLQALVESLKEVGDVVVAAPDREQSGVGAALTLHHPVRIAPTPPIFDGVEAYAVEGTPADCVVLATTTLIKGPVDLLVSGINAGSNLGNDVFVSGTVGAAFHGYFRAIPSVAISVTSLTNLRYDVAAKLALVLAQRVKEGVLPRELLLNVNIPNKPLNELKGIRITRAGSNSYTELIKEGYDARRKYYWLERGRPAHQLEEGTDIWAVQNDHISITPLGDDVTAHSLLPHLERLHLPLGETSAEPGV
ncbi:MAG: 5'/3'-nucleotidase SurE, partial [Dehalococcoidia bacterium]